MNTKKTKQRNPLWVLVRGAAEAAFRPKRERDRTKYRRKQKHRNDRP